MIELPAPGMVVPGKDDVELYARTYTTILRSSGEVRLRAFTAAHVQVRSSLHAGAASDVPDAGAFIYAIQRLPAAVACVERVLLGQEGEHFRAVLGDAVGGWQRLEAAARRRQWRWDGEQTMTVHVSSQSDVDDVIPTLVAYQIEWNKLNARLSALAETEAGAALLAGPPPGEAQLAELGEHLGLSQDDWQRLRLLLAEPVLPPAERGSDGVPGADEVDGFWQHVRLITAGEKDMRVRLLGGHDVGYTRLVRRWWRPIGEALARNGLERRPIYFISSNMHGVVNLVSGYAPRRSAMLWEFLERSDEAERIGEIQELREMRGRANAENLLYYAARLWHRYHPQPEVKEERRLEEEARGIVHIPAAAGYDVGAQVIELARLQPEDFDPRLRELAHVAIRSDAVLLNIDYPLGLAAYHILREVLAEATVLRGAYAIGKAATLNGAIGDVMISNVVYDEHSRNTYTFENAFAYGDVAPYLERGSALDNQKAVTVRGTFLQNREYLEFFYRELYTVVEMEAGPLLSAVYEGSYSSRHPAGEHVHFHRMPFDFGVIHYASDTPYTQARTLGGRSLSFEGIDSTYASTVAVLRRILTVEAQRLRAAPAA